MSINQRNKQQKRLQEGFTLIELMVVIAIVGVLIAVAVPQYGNYMDRASIRACEGELASYRNMALANNSLTLSSGTSQPPDFSFQSCDLESTDALAKAFSDAQNYEDEIATKRTTAGTISIKSGNIVSEDS